ncbi:MAG TPA: DUF5597 domain-containing protein [Steroidobacteraceae bacterium]|nr:DUF5597 domain-containing protein [Steroidobacteraceae bacterium]
MKPSIVSRLSFAAFVACASLAVESPASAAPAHLEKQGSTQNLVVDGQPFLILGGELGNSSASSAAYLEPHWPRLKAMNLNTVLAPVYWELLEPSEGRFDWSSLDTMLADARAQEIKLVLLWFGAWKNSMSTYVPSWVKRDQKRFPRVQLADGSSVEILSAFGAATLESDTKAFAALMEHLKQVDGAGTVLMIQVENEIGMLPIARERGAVADAKYAAALPKDLVRALAQAGEKLEPEMREIWRAKGATAKTWQDLSTEETTSAEIFTAWHYARFVESLVKAGKAKYDLPMYVNAALNRTGRKPGEYPSGGPLPHLIDVWKAGAPSLDFLAPDIYFPNFAPLAARYRRADNTLFVPEANNATNPQGPANAFFQFGELDSFGFSPFSIESLGDAPNALSRSYEVMRQLTPMLLANRGKARMAGFRTAINEDGSVVETPVKKTLGGIEFTVTFVDPWTPKDQQTSANHGGLVIQTGDEEFWFAGQGITVTFRGADGGPAKVGIDVAEEGAFVEGKWVAGRRLNGDQTHQGRHVRLPPGNPQIQRVKFYRYR